MNETGITVRFKSNASKGKLEGLTVNQCIITGIIQAVKLLKKTCNIKSYTQTYVGLAKYDGKEEGKWTKLNNSGKKVPVAKFSLILELV